MYQLCSFFLQQKFEKPIAWGQHNRITSFRIRWVCVRIKHGSITLFYTRNGGFKHWCKLSIGVWRVTHSGLAFHPGRVKRLLAASCWEQTWVTLAELIAKTWKTQKKTLNISFSCLWRLYFRTNGNQIWGHADETVNYETVTFKNWHWLINVNFIHSPSLLLATCQMRASPAITQFSSVSC